MDLNQSRSLVVSLPHELADVCTAKNRILEEMVESSLELARKGLPTSVDLDALVREGKRLRSGEGMTAENIQAFKAFYQAAIEGHAEAQFLVCECYQSGCGIKQDRTQYLDWLNKSSELGFATALNRRGYESQDRAEQNKWFRLAADQNNINGQMNLGQSYHLGLGVEQDTTEAVKWYRKAALQGSADAQDMLAFFYEHGEGVTQSDEEAVKWWRESANQGNQKAQYHLGICYAKGLGVQQNDEEAAKWWRTAASQGYDRAQFDLGNCYAKGRGVPQNDSEALNWWKMAAEQGASNAQFSLGYCYAEGRGTEQNNLRAYLWLRLATDDRYLDEEKAKKANIDARALEARLTPSELETALELCHAYDKQHQSRCPPWLAEMFGEVARREPLNTASL